MSRRSPKQKSLWPVIMALILLGAVSIGAGYLGGRYLLRGFAGDGVFSPSTPSEDPAGEPLEDPDPDEPEGTPEEEPPEAEEADEETAEEEPDDEESSETEPVAEHTLTGRGLQLYRVQVGAFTVEENAATLLEEMGDMGRGGVVMFDGENFRVVSDLMYREEDARAFEEELEAAGFETLVSSWDLPPLDVTLAVGEINGPVLDDLTRLLEDLLVAHAGTTPASGRSRTEEIRTVAEQASYKIGELDADWVPPAYREFIINHLESHLTLARNRPESRECHQSYLRLAWAFRTLRNVLD